MRALGESAAALLIEVRAQTEQGEAQLCRRAEHEEQPEHDRRALAEVLRAQLPARDQNQQCDEQRRELVRQYVLPDEQEEERLQVRDHEAAALVVAVVQLDVLGRDVLEQCFRGGALAELLAVEENVRARKHQRRARQHEQQDQPGEPAARHGARG